MKDNLKINKEPGIIKRKWNWSRVNEYLDNLIIIIMLNIVVTYKTKNYRFPIILNKSRVQ